MLPSVWLIALVSADRVRPFTRTEWLSGQAVARQQVLQTCYLAQGIDV